MSSCSAPEPLCASSETSMTVPSVMRPWVVSCSRRVRSRSSGVLRRARISQPAPSANTTAPARSSASNRSWVIRDCRTLLPQPAPRYPSKALSLADLLVVLQERRQPFIGQRMVEHHVQDLERDGGDVRPRESGFHHMHWMPDRRGEYLRLVSVIAVDGQDVADQIHAVLADIVEPADERAHVGRARL